ncbi:hypothetical protein P3T76_011423 [Phytophthora citrophthora]|uniref:PH domain-containing protein n=1 Tax=Phytophthora citrophthora TaxID=4793 RepID=A0AAD9LF59_9STRA|nr:hypothetical protein P3T76_011423 [Phytophthora citrophthora]
MVSISSRPAGQPTALLSAYLLKQSAGKWKRKRWNQRWFVLDRDNGVLRYFRHASPLEAVPLRQDAHGVVLLKQTGVSLVVQGDLPPGVPTPFCFTVLVDGQRELRICADTNAEFRQWTTAISAIISPSRAGAKVSPSKVPSPVSTASAVEVSSPLRPVEKKEKVETGPKEQDPREIVQQMCVIVASNKTVLVALNPVIVLVRFGNVPTWILVAVLANALCVWLLWFRKPMPQAKSASHSAASRRLAVPTDVNSTPTSSSPESVSGSEVALDKTNTKFKSTPTVSRDRVPSSSTEEPSPKKTAFSGVIDGVQVAAGASLKMCSTEVVPGSWTHVDATRFNVRQGPNYRKTKLKAASAPGLLQLVAVDVYQSNLKADNIGSIVDLSALKPETGKLDLFIVNCQVPSYQPSNPLWGEKQGDGPGLTSSRTSPSLHLSEKCWMHQENHHCKLFGWVNVYTNTYDKGLLKDFMQHQSWVSERFKAIGVVVNPQEQTLGRAERHLLETYNGQPILTRPQHRFYQGEGYFEVDVNAHDFNYIARKGLVGVSTHACNMILDFGYVLEGQEDHELPEQILGSVRLCKVDVSQAPRLS